MDLDLIIILLHRMLLSAVLALGFALLLHNPKKMLAHTALLGGLTQGIYTILIHLNIYSVVAIFICSLIISSIAIWFAKIFITHYKVFAMPALVVLFPVNQFYVILLSVIELSIHGYDDISFKILTNNFFQSCLILIAITTATVLPKLLSKKLQN